MYRYIFRRDQQPERVELIPAGDGTLVSSSPPALDASPQNHIAVDKHCLYGSYHHILDLCIYEGHWALSVKNLDRPTEQLETFYYTKVGNEFPGEYRGSFSFSGVGENVDDTLYLSSLIMNREGSYNVEGHGRNIFGNYTVLGRYYFVANQGQGNLVLSRYYEDAPVVATPSSELNEESDPLRIDGGLRMGEVLREQTRKREMKVQLEIGRADAITLFQKIKYEHQELSAIIDKWIADTKAFRSSISGEEEEKVEVEAYDGEEEEKVEVVAYDGENDFLPSMTVLEEIEKGGPSILAEWTEKQEECEKFREAIKKVKDKFPGCSIEDGLILGDTGATVDEIDGITAILFWGFGVAGQIRMFQRSLKYSHMLENGSLDWYFQSLIRYLTSEFGFSVGGAANLVLKKTAWIDVVPIKAKWNSRKEKWFRYLTEDLGVRRLSVSLLTKILKKFPHAKFYAVGTDAYKILDRLRPEFGDRIVQTEAATHGMRLRNGHGTGEEIIRTLEQAIIPIARGMVQGPCRPFDNNSVQAIDSFAKMAGDSKIQIALSVIAQEVERRMEDAKQGTSKIDIATSLEPCDEYSEEDIERYIKCCDIKSFDESYLEEYDLVQVEPGDKDSIEVKCSKCGVKRWTRLTLMDGSVLKETRYNSILMGLDVYNGNGDSVVLENGFGSKAKHALNEVNKFFGGNQYVSRTDIEAISQKGLSNGQEYLPVYNQKTKAGRVEIGRISFAPNISSKATIVVGNCRCGWNVYDPVDENHGRELVHLGVVRERKQREINSDDEEGGGEEYYRSKTAKQLRQLCSRRGLDGSGKKEQLIDGLIDDDNNDGNHSV